MSARLVQLLTRYVSVGLAWFSGHVGATGADDGVAGSTTQAVVAGVIAIAGFVTDRILHAKLFEEKK